MARWPRNPFQQLAACGTPPPCQRSAHIYAGLVYGCIPEVFYQTCLCGVPAGQEGIHSGQPERD
eukprot:7562881-Pyramimonas_sp.AAC.1